MLFPISDDDREVDTPATVTYSFICINVLLFVVQLLFPDFTYGWSVVPKEIVTGVDLVEPQLVELPNGENLSIPQSKGPWILWITLLSSMFMHGGFGHIAGNMLYLWIFGNNVEHRFGHGWFLVFYLVAGLCGSMAQIAADPYSVIPNLGASGAIAGVLGAYLVLFPHNRVHVVFLYSVFSVPAIVVLGLWIATQLVSGFGSIASTSSGGGVAYMAHIGGFFAGVALAAWARMRYRAEPDSLVYRQYERDPRDRRIW
ncbi:MAG: rhomboid family intramembrane serine protease [Pirellulales bacterium]